MSLSAVEREEIDDVVGLERAVTFGVLIAEAERGEHALPADTVGLRLVRQQREPVLDVESAREILRALEEEGALGRTGRKRYADTHALPASGVMDIIDRDADGELIARMRGPDRVSRKCRKYCGNVARGGSRDRHAPRGRRVVAYPCRSAPRCGPI